MRCGRKVELRTEDYARRRRTKHGRVYSLISKSRKKRINADTYEAPPLTSEALFARRNAGVFVAQLPRFITGTRVIAEALSMDEFGLKTGIKAIVDFNS